MALDGNIRFIYLCAATVIAVCAVYTSVLAKMGCIYGLQNGRNWATKMAEIALPKWLKKGSENS
jgi:hypothetical protein